MVPGRFSAKATKSFWKALGQPRNQRAAGEVPGQPEYTRAGPSLVRGTLRRRTSMARPLKTCSNGLLRNKLAAPGKAVALRGIGGFSVESSVHACHLFQSAPTRVAGVTSPSRHCCAEVISRLIVRIVSIGMHRFNAVSVGLQDP
jgi:hypothetical protein